MRLSAVEYEQLYEQWGSSEVLQEIEELSCYMESSGKRYKNHFAALSSWLLRRERERKAREAQDRCEQNRRYAYQGPKLEEW